MSVSSPLVTAAHDCNDETSLRYEGWRVVFAAHCGVLVSFGSLLVFTFGIFLKPLSTEFGWKREAISSAFGIAAITVAAVSPLLGRWLDRYGPRRIVLPSFAAFGLAFASLALLTRSLIHFYAVFVVLGLVGNATTQMGYARAVSSWFQKRRGLALSLVVAGVGVGSVILPIAAQALIDSFGWRAAYAVLGGLVLLLGIPLTALFVREKPGEGPTPDGAAFHSGSTFSQGLRSRAFWILVGMLFLSSVSINGAVTHLAALLTDRGVTAKSAAAAASMLGASGFAARIATGWFLDRFFAPYVAFCLLGCTAGGILLLAQAATLPAGLLAAGLIGVGLGGEADVTPYVLSRYFGLKSFSALYGLTWTFYALAGAIGPVILGRTYDITGSYTKLLTMLAGTTLLAAVIILGMPKYPIAPNRNG
jgi:MFS family permease